MYVQLGSVCVAPSTNVDLRTSLDDLRHAFPFGPVVLHNHRSTTHSRLEPTVHPIQGLPSRSRVIGCCRLQLFVFAYYKAAEQG
jgi:hypothetical protein